MDRLISEIKGCLEHDYYFAALSLALTIPDVCASFEKGAKPNGVDYASWCDKWLDDYLVGDVIYSLRCSLFHSMDADFGEEPAFKAYKKKQKESGEDRNISYRFFVPHADAIKPMIYHEETDESITNTTCVSMLICELISGYEKFMANTPAFSHNYLNIWFEG